MTQNISVTLSGSIVYVSGIVNGKDYTFTLTGTTDAGTVWSAVVDRAEDDIYNVEVTAINSAGNATTFSTVVYYGLLNLITDRSANDVARWRELRNKGWEKMTAVEQSEWRTSMKGAYNSSDLNRVGAALNFVRDRLAEFGYLPAGAFTARVDWNEGEIPTAAEVTNYLSYVSTVRESFVRLPTTPPVPADARRLTYREANDIEQIILDVNTLISNMIAAWYFSGELYCGEL